MLYAIQKLHCLPCKASWTHKHNMHTHKYTHTNTHMHTHKYMYTYACAHTHMQTHTHACMHTNTRTHTRTHTHTHTLLTTVVLQSAEGTTRQTSQSRQEQTFTRDTPTLSTGAAVIFVTATSNKWPYRWDHIREELEEGEEGDHCRLYKVRFV